MSVFDLVARMAGFERRAVKAAGREVESPYTWPAWRTGQPDWTPSTLQGFARAGYGDNALVFACIAAKAQSAALAPLVAYTGQRDAPVRLPDQHWLAQLLLRPNPHQSWYELEELARTYLELDGNVFAYLARGRSGPSTTLRSAQDAMIEGIFLLRSDRVRVVPGTTRTAPLLGYVYDPDDSGMYQREPFLPDEIVHIKYPSPLDPFEGLGRGSSPLGAAAKETDVDNAATSFLKTFFDQAVVPFGLLKSKQKLFDNDVARIRERLRAQYGGIQNWGDVMILDADAEYQRLGLTMQEMSFEALDMRNEARICEVLGVPPIIVGANVGLQRSTFANYGEARAAFWEDKLIPGVYRRFEDGWNTRLAVDGAWVAYDYDNVPALRQRQAEVWDRALKAWESGLAKRNEARGMVRLDPVPDAEDGFRNEAATNATNDTNGTNVSRFGADPDMSGRDDDPEDEDSPEGDEAAEGDGEGEKGRPFSGRVLITRKAGLKALDLGFDPAAGGDRERAIERLERDLERRLSQALREDLERQLAEVRKWARRRGPAASGEWPAVRMLAQVVIPELRDAATVGAAATVARLANSGVAVDWTLANAEAVAWAQAYTFDLVKGIDATTARLLQREIAAWVQAGTSLGELQAMLTPIFGPVRAEMIAITETTRAYAEAAERSWEAVNRQYGEPIVRGKRWLTNNDERVCPICSALGGLTWSEDGSVPATRDEQRENALVVALGQPFTHPGGNGAQARFAGRTYPRPPAHVRCRCRIAEVI